MTMSYLISSLWLEWTHVCTFAPHGAKHKATWRIYRRERNMEQNNEFFKKSLKRTRKLQLMLTVLLKTWLHPGHHLLWNHFSAVCLYFWHIHCSDMSKKLYFDILEYLNPRSLSDRYIQHPYERLSWNLWSELLQSGWRNIVNVNQNAKTRG